MSKEKLKPNDVGATLFIGAGGIGSDIVKRVAKRSINDNTENVRFVVLDTDVNDLFRLKDGAVVHTVQTSSPRSIKDYLQIDIDAKKNWFPENRILDDKTVSEGAGQVRAISRLALNATIKQGFINTLYNAIDELYLKDGSDKKQAVKIIIVSTAAGGTGSGIAMILGMLARQYIKQNYPESAAIIRGLLILPSVLDVVIKNESERLSLKRNGYATIKEINAFMMKGSGFFESNPMLKRYKDMCVVVPTTASGFLKLDNLPFDFCFLMDRYDENQGSMKQLEMYKDNAAQSLYEQNIGPMKQSSSSKEDNIIKEFIDPDKLGRCRFGGMGSSILRYPYDKIRDYIAYTWLAETLTGVNSENEDEADAEDAVDNSLLMYDKMFWSKKKQYESNPYANPDDEPKQAEVYVNAVETDKSQFSQVMRDKILKQKAYVCLDKATREKNESSFTGLMSCVVDDYYKSVENEILHSHVESIFGDAKISLARNKAEKGGVETRLNACMQMHEAISSGRVKYRIQEQTRSIFSSRLSIRQKQTDSFAMENFFSVNGEAIHPNAVRYLLYKLIADMAQRGPKANVNDNNYLKQIEEILKPEKDKKTLAEKCEDADDQTVGSSKVDDCNKTLDDLYAKISSTYKKMTTKYICETAIPILMSLSKEYEEFYKSFTDKMNNIFINKDSIVSELEFKKGGYVKYICGDEAYLKELCELCHGQAVGTSITGDLAAKIFDSVREKMFDEEIAAASVFAVSKNIDLFDDVIVEYFKSSVDKKCADIIDKDIFRALLLEFKIKCKLTKRNSDFGKDDIRNEHFNARIREAGNLAVAGMLKRDFDEARDIAAIAYNSNIIDGEGIRIKDYVEPKNGSESVSKYDLRFFKAMYNVMPTQLSKFCCPDVVKDSGIVPIDFENVTDSGDFVGDYFSSYQEYMEHIGPDSKANAVITPHIDKRWNSISVMPEIDMKFQESLMMSIHKAFFYGFIYGNIKRYAPSKYDISRKIYRYSVNSDGYKTFIVSNGTKCDQPYEVLDSLYFDRAAVTALCNYADNVRIKEVENEGRKYEESTFFKAIDNFKRESIINEYEDNKIDNEYISIFEIPLIYYNSLPPRLRDMTEIGIMFKTIIHILKEEFKAFIKSDDDVNPLLAKELIKHYNALVESYKNHEKTLGDDLKIESNDVMSLLKTIIVENLDMLDVSDTIKGNLCNE